jgi:transposase InsO family protein
MDDKTKREIALWRLGVLGPLVSARLEHGDRQAHFDEIAGRLHQMPDGRVIELSPRTIESWYYAYKRDGFEALHPSTRSDHGQSRAIAPEVAELILRAKREKPRRSIRRIIRMLERARKAKPGELSRSSVHRLLRVAGISARPLRGPSAERRSFIAEHAGDLWVGDAMHGRQPVITPDGKLRKWYLLSQIDNATRYVMHSYITLSENAAAQEHGFKEAILKYGLPCTYYVDRGAAYVAWSLRMICAELGIHLRHAGAGDCEAKGVIERWHRTFREEVEDELPPEPLPLADLNAKLWAWLGAEYHVRVHDTTKRAPRDHFLAEVDAIRPVPRGTRLDEVFLHREDRLVRKDGTVRWRGGFLEVRPELCGQTVELRYDPSDEAALPRVFVDGRFACDTVPLDRLKNMIRRRRRLAGEPAPDAAPSGLDPLSQIEAEHYRRTRLTCDGPDDDTEDDEED